MLTGDDGTFTIQDSKLVSLAHKTLCDLGSTFLNLVTCIFGKD